MPKEQGIGQRLIPYKEPLALEARQELKLNSSSCKA